VHEPASGTTPYGGYYGMNGCGGHIAVSMGATYTEAPNHVNESWLDISDNSLDGQGNDFWYAEWLVNWDSETWPINIEDGNATLCE
jgi:hypothetical protein